MECINRVLEELRGWLLVIEILRDRSILRKSILVFWIFSWVRRSTLQLGAQGGEIKRKREKDLQLSAQIELYVFI
jgi:hypothetical protein